MGKAPCSATNGGVGVLPREDAGAAKAGARPSMSQGAAGLQSKPGAAPLESKSRIFGPSSDDPKAVAYLAETTAGELQDARIVLADLIKSHAKPAEIINDATCRVAMAQAEADKRVADFVRVQEKLAVQMKDTEDTEAAVGLAVARSLRDIANGSRPGRATLAEKTTIADAKLATARFDQAIQSLNKLGVDFKTAAQNLRRAASSSRAAWAAVNDNAIRNGDKALREIASQLNVAGSQLKIADEYAKQAGVEIK